MARAQKRRTSLPIAAFGRKHRTSSGVHRFRARREDSRHLQLKVALPAITTNAMLRKEEAHAAGFARPPSAR
jgi:hypothetical protein